MISSLKSSLCCWTKNWKYVVCDKQTFSLCNWNTFLVWRFLSFETIFWTKERCPSKYILTLGWYPLALQIRKNKTTLEYAIAELTLTNLCMYFYSATIISHVLFTISYYVPIAYLWMIVHCTGIIASSTSLVVDQGKC